MQRSENNKNIDEKKMPSLSEQGKNLAKFTFEVVKDVVTLTEGSAIVSEDEQKNRLSICQECEFFEKLNSRCSQCGCFMKVKTKFTISKCPIQKW